MTVACALEGVVHGGAHGKQVIAIDLDALQSRGNAFLCEGLGAGLR